MLFIVIGIFGFVSLLVFDLMSMKDKVYLKYFFALFGLSLITYATYQLMNFQSDLFLNETLRVLGLLFSVIFLILLIYSVLIEVGSNTYSKIAQPKLVTNGTYSLVRHPGVIWLFLLYFWLAIYTQNSLILLSAFIWSFVNIIYVVIQEKLVLSKLFQDYQEYRNSTPMVIPNFMSIKKFITTNNWRKE